MSSGLDDRTVMESVDAHGMLSTIDGFPAQCEEALRLGRDLAWSPPTELRRIVVCGMGGSAMAGELVRRVVPLPTDVSRSYSLPRGVGRDTLLVAASYSGNTAETLSSLEEGLRSHAQILCATSGGAMRRLAEERRLPWLRLPTGYQPRAALAFLALGLLAALERVPNLGGSASLDDACLGLAAARDAWTATVPARDNAAKQIASSLHGRIPVVYGTAGNTELVAMRWKTQINENAKQPAFWGVLPEANHNEILGWENASLASSLCAVFLRSPDDVPQVVARIDITRGRLERAGIRCLEVSSSGDSPLDRLLHLVYLGDYVSLYLATLNGVDPTPVEGIEQFKRDLEARLSSDAGRA